MITKKARNVFAVLL